MTISEKSLSIAIKVTIEIETKKTYAMGLQFRIPTKGFKRYWEDRLGSVCLVCFRISQNELGGFEGKKSKCVMFAGNYKMK